MTVTMALGAVLLTTGCMQLPPSAQPSPAPATPAPATAAPAEPDETAVPRPSATEAEAANARGVLGRASVDVPDGWEETDGDATFTLRYAQPDSATYEVIGIADDFGSFHGARAAASIFIAEAQMQVEGFRILSQDDIAVPGASSGVRVDFTFGPADDTSDGMWVVAVDDSNGHSIAIAYSGGEAEVADAELDAIAESVELLPAR